MSLEVKMEDADVVSMLQSGKEEAFSMLYDNYSALIFGTIVRIVGDKIEAENLLQDCFVKVWQNFSRFDESKGKLATWLINIARNTAIDFTRSKYFSQKRKNQNLENLVSVDATHSVAPPMVETLGIRQLVEKLTPGCRQVIEWMYFEGYTQQEIAENFGIPLGTVKSRTRLAIKELRASFQ
jgi:RNA polymerase sigma-70 factor, ECF subfamily